MAPAACDVGKRPGVRSSPRDGCGGHRNCSSHGLSSCLSWHLERSSRGAESVAMKRERFGRPARGEATDMIRPGFEPEWVTPTGEESDSFVKAGGLDKI